LISLSAGFEVVFQPDGRRGRFHKRTTVLRAARELGVDINAVCGGVGSCGKCIVKIVQGMGNLSDPTTDEVELLGPESLGEGFRLACRSEIDGHMVVLVPKESRTGTQRLQTEGLDTPVRLEPLVKKQTIDNTTRILYGDEVLETCPSDDVPICGFAVDIGSTKLAGYLMDLSTGGVLSVGTAMNPQIPFGEDIISRLSYALKGWGSRETLHESLVEGIRQMLAEACGKADADPEDVYDLVFVGNTAMQHFLLDLDPTPLTHSPFAPASLEQRDIESASLGLGNPRGRMHFLPLIAGFVGADCVADILATGVHRSDGLCFLIDIGTNTEIVVGNRDRMVACSCASGPAFEGAHVRHGMRAASGAIEGVWIDQESLEPSIKTIDDAEPLGICGSGLIDALSEMLKAGVIDTSGRIRTEVEHHRIRKRGDTSEYVIAWGKETGLKEDIVVSQLDVRELQKGKAAMFSGARIAMDQLGLSPSDIANVYMAGAFGTYINRESAINVGMIPEFSLTDIEQVGNAAGTGARMALLSASAREEAKKIRGKVEYIELAARPDYGQAYTDALLFPHRDLGLFPETVKKLGAANLVLGQIHKRKKGRALKNLLHRTF
jgi:uncharacterized 2Fe-2S/4Fe-4S cluster protein (DUF4445 family)